jgi:hypothetical protein
MPYEQKQALEKKILYVWISLPIECLVWMLSVNDAWMSFECTNLFMQKPINNLKKKKKDLQIQARKYYQQVQTSAKNIGK